MRRNGRIKVRFTGQVNIMPAESAHLLSPRSGQQGYHDVGAYPQPCAIGCLQDQLGLGQRERLGRASGASLGNIAQQDDVPAYQAPGLGFPESATQD